MEKIYSSKELRKLAEKIAKESPENLRSENIEDIQTVIQELNIHRIQLQMQNEELQKAHQLLNLEKTRYETLFNTSPVGFVIMDEHGIILDLNDRASQLFEKEKDMLLQANIYDLCADENIKDNLFLIIRKAIKTKQMQQCDIKFVRNKAINFDVQLWASYFEEDNNITRIQLAFADISVVEELKSQLQQSQKMEAIGNLAGGIAHDFNNMLSVIIGNVELALEDTPNYNPIYENLQEIQHASSRAQDVVKQLLTFAKKSLVKLEPLSIAAVVETSLKMFRPVIPTSIQIQTNLDDNKKHVLADATQIHQIIINLLTNSMDAMPNKIGIIDISVTDIELTHIKQLFSAKLQPGSYVQLLIHDSGHGIDPLLLPRIFDPYFSTKDNIKNTGLGLSVVLGIVEALGGGIQIESDQRNGTTFKIYLPATQKSPKKSQQMNDVLTGSGKILFIDDEITITKFGRQLIERLGYSVEVANDPIIAIEKFRLQPDAFDLVITDMTMPNMNGDKMVQEIKAIRADLPVIICTGFHENMDKKKAEELGAHFAMKPLKKDELAQLIHKALAKGKSA